MTHLLISVNSVTEAQLALENGADIIDLKDPNQGALGMLLLPTIVEVVGWVNKRKPVSATVGDLPLITAQDMMQLATKVTELVAANVDIIKIGFFDITRINLDLLMMTLTKMCLPKSVKFIAVLFAENRPQSDFLLQVDLSFFSGVMIDTAVKNGSTYLDYNQKSVITTFAKMMKEKKFSFGIAGSLQLKDVDSALLLNPDYIGFRGGVCFNNQRINMLDADKIKAVRKLL